MRVFVLLNNADLIMEDVVGKRKLYGKAICLLRLFINVNIVPTHELKTFLPLKVDFFFFFSIYVFIT